MPRAPPAACRHREARRTERVVPVEARADSIPETFSFAKLLRACRCFATYNRLDAAAHARRLDAAHLSAAPLAEAPAFRARGTAAIRRHDRRECAVRSCEARRRRIPHRGTSRQALGHARWAFQETERWSFQFHHSCERREPAPARRRGI